jgi:hypothetical protein
MDSDAGAGAGDRDQAQEQVREVPPQVLLVLVGGYAAALAIMVDALAVAAQHRWWFGAAATLVVLVRVIPDALELATWVDRPQPWPLPFDPRPWLLVMAVNLTGRLDWSQLPPLVRAYLEETFEPERLEQWQRRHRRTPQSRLVTVLVGLCLATVIAGWASWQPPTS